MRSLSNILKSDKILLCQEKKLVFSDRISALIYPSIKRHVEQEINESKIDLMNIQKEAQKEAERIVEEARKQAEIIIGQAEDRVQTILDKARNDGYAAGYHQGILEGRVSGEKEYESSLGETKAEKEQYIHMRRELYKSCEEDMVRLAVEIARKIIDVSLEEDEEAYLRIAQRALNEVKGQKKAQLRVSSEDYPKVMAKKDLLDSLAEGADHIEVVEDMSLKKGSCIVETQGGAVDSSVDVQMAQIKDIFESLIQKNRR